MATSRASPASTIVVALDGSPAAASALPIARLLAARLRSGVEILHVVSASPTAGGVACLPPGVAGCDGVRVRVRSGDPAAQILRTVEDPAVALLVMTTHGGALGSPSRLGRVAERVIADTMRPVLLVRPEAVPAAIETLRAEAEHLLLPLDGAPATLRALGPVLELGRRLDASLDLLFVVTGEQAQTEEPGTIVVPRFVDQPQHTWPEWEREVIEQLGICCDRHPLGLPARVFAVGGRVPEAVLHFAREHRDGMIVLVRRSRLEPGHGTILRELLACAECSVIVTGGERVRAHRPLLRLVGVHGASGGDPKPSRHPDVSRPTTTVVHALLQSVRRALPRPPDTP